MNSLLRVIEPGLQTTVQDLGRPGLSAIGVSASGAADELSLRIGNRLVGNADSAAALEMTLVGGEFEFSGRVEGVLTGAECRGQIVRASGDSQPISPWTPFRAGEGDRLIARSLLRGCRSYLCITGGVITPLILGSRATHLASRIGGMQGRALARDDLVPVGSSSRRMDGPRQAAIPALVDLACAALHRRTLRVAPGAHHDLFGSDARERLSGSTYRVAEQSDRTGVRLSGAGIPAPGDGRLTTEPMTAGAIQIIGGGPPATASHTAIVLGVDHPTTGGYPVIGCVASIDLPALGQLVPRQEIRFEWVTVESARRAYVEQWRLIDELLPPATRPA